MREKPNEGSKPEFVISVLTGGTDTLHSLGEIPVCCIKIVSAVSPISDSEVIKEKKPNVKNPGSGSVRLQASADKITATCLLFVPSFAERLYQGDISNWKLLAGKEKRKTTLDQWRVKIMTTLIWQLFKRGLCHLVRTFPLRYSESRLATRLPTRDISTLRCGSWTA